MSDNQKCPVCNKLFSDNDCIIETDCCSQRVHDDDCYRKCVTETREAPWDYMCCTLCEARVFAKLGYPNMDGYDSDASHGTCPECWH